MITIALSKGKLLEPAMELFRKAGYVSKGLSPGSRRLIIECSEKDLTFMIIRPSDVPTYVEYGAADVGVVGAIRAFGASPVGANGIAEIPPCA